MQLRRFELEKDYSSYEVLYKEWNLPVTKKDWIPEDTFIVENDGKLVCSGSLYQLSQTPMFWIEGLISNKNIDKTIRKEALIVLINKLYEVGKEKGAEIILSSTPRDGLKDIFEENGFYQTPEKYYHLGRFK